METPERFYTLRKTLGLTQGEIGEKLGIGFQMISSIEKGTRSLTQRHLRDLEERLSVDTKWLLTGKGNMFLPSYSELADRCLKIAHTNKCYTPSDFTIATGLDIKITTLLYKALIPPPKEQLTTILQSFPDVSREWLIDNIGGMLKEEEQININDDIRESLPDSNAVFMTINRLLTILEEQNKINNKHADTSQKHADNLSELIKKIDVNEHKEGTHERKKAV